MLKSLIGHAVSVPPQLVRFRRARDRKSHPDRPARQTRRRRSRAGNRHRATTSRRCARWLSRRPAGHPLHVDRAHGGGPVRHRPRHRDRRRTRRNSPTSSPRRSAIISSAPISSPRPTSEETLHVESGLDRPSGFSAFFAQLCSRKPDLEEIKGKVSGDRDAAGRALGDVIARRLEAASHVDADEARWVIAHLSRGGPLTAAERRLLAFLRNEAASAPAELTSLCAQPRTAPPEIDSPREGKLGCAPGIVQARLPAARPRATRRRSQRPDRAPPRKRRRRRRRRRRVDNLDLWRQRAIALPPQKATTPAAPSVTTRRFRTLRDAGDPSGRAVEAERPPTSRASCSLTTDGQVAMSPATIRPGRRRIEHDLRAARLA